MAEAPSLAETITRLFETIKRPDGRKYTVEEVADWCSSWLIERGQGGTFSKQYLSQLRTGVKLNPTKSHLEALAAAFDVDPAIFLDSERSQKILDDLDLVLALKEADVQQIALRTVSLNPANRKQLIEILGKLQANQVAEELAAKQGRRRNGR